MVDAALVGVLALDEHGYSPPEIPVLFVPHLALFVFLLVAAHIDGKSDPFLRLPDGRFGSFGEVLVLEFRFFELDDWRSHAIFNFKSRIFDNV